MVLLYLCWTHKEQRDFVSVFVCRNGCVMMFFVRTHKAEAHHSVYFSHTLATVTVQCLSRINGSLC